MNAIAENQSALTVMQSRDPASIILSNSFERVQSFAALMARGAVTVPRHFNGNVADCLAVSLQAIAWGMSPFAVAQKTFTTPSGQLGYEGQLVNAVIQASGVLSADPEYEFIGDWSKVLGKFEKRQSSKGNDYFVATYKAADEAGLGVIVRATIAGESKPRELTLMMVQAQPRFSTQWATDPKQQICYLALRKFVRLYKPGVILGVYTHDEIDQPQPEKFMGPAEVVETPKADPEPVFYGDAKFEHNLPKWSETIKSGAKTAADYVAFMKTRKTPLTAEQIKKLEAAKTEKPAVESAKPSAAKTPEQAFTYAEVADQLANSKDLEQLAAAASVINGVADAAQRQELGALYDRRARELGSADPETGELL